MATVNKDFKIKNGLIVEGSTATVNGYDILTKNTSSDNYIINLIGGSATPINTPDTVVLRDANGDFAAGEITADLVGNVTGQVSDISNHNTDDLTEGTTNKYFTDGRVKDVLTASTQTNISITNVGGVLHIEAENGVADSTTDDLDEGTTNKYYTDARARLALSEGTGINYDNTTGTISADLGDFDTDDLVEGASNKYFTTGRIDDHLTGGDGISYSSGTISADLGTGLNISAGQIAVDRSTVDTWYDANGAAGDVASDLSYHEGLTSGVHGVTGSVVGTTDTQDLSNKRFIDTVYFTDGTTISNEGEIAIRSVSHDFDVQANYGDLNLKTIAAGSDVNITADSGDIVLNPSGAAYVGSASAENEIATHGYVDNAVAGLTWKQSVNVLATSNVALSGSTPLVVDGHTLSDGYRVLLTAQSTNADNGIYDLSITAGSYTLARSADADVFGELVGAAVFVMEGTQYNNTSWVQGNHYLSDFTSQSWTQFSGTGSVTAGTGIIVDGLEVSVDFDVVASQTDLSTGLGTKQDSLTVGDGLDLTGATLNVNSGEMVNKVVNGVSGNSYGIVGNATYLDVTNPTGYNSEIDVDIASLESKLTTDGFASTTDISNAITNLNLPTTYDAYGAASTALQDAKDYADALDTDDISEGTTNKYYTDSRVKSVLTGSTQTNISITEVAGELIITAENGVDDSTTDDLDEGINNHYFTDTRAKDSAADLLTNATLSNITITGTGAGLIITAENGVAGSDTDDLTEGSTNLYFTDARAQSAVDGTTRSFTSINLNTYRTEEATQQYVAAASTVTAHTFTGNKSVKYLVRVVGDDAGVTHSQVTELLVTVDGNNNIAVTEYGTIYTSTNPLASATADYSAGDFRLRVTTAIAGAEVIAAATIMSWAD